MSTHYANKFTLQISDTVRLIMMDERPGVLAPPTIYENPTICTMLGEVVMSLPNARALRDLLVQYVKDEPAAETIQ
jgi:hypothetical protein